MSNVEKIIDKMRRQPNGIRPEEAEKVLKAYGYEMVRQRGSHKQYLNKISGKWIFLIEFHNMKGT